MLHEVAIHPEGIERRFEKKLSVEPTIHEGAVIYKSKLGSWTEIGRNTRIVESEIGDYTYDAGDVSIIYSVVGNFCSIASHTCVNPGNHPMHRVTQHHCTYRRSEFGFGEDDEEFFQWRRDHSCAIGPDVWIGHGAIVLPGVSIGTGAVIGAGAVVSKGVGPYEVAAGVPAKLIRKRFGKETVEKLLATAWWNWDRKTLEERFDDLCNLDVFLEKYAP